MTLAFCVPGKAVPLARSRFDSRTRHSYLPESSRDYRTLIQVCAREAMTKAGITEPMDCALKIFIKEIRKTPKRSGRASPTGRPDLDNIVKAVLDALNGLAWVDDAQVVMIEATKEYGAVPSVHVRVSEFKLGGFI